MSCDICGRSSCCVPFHSPEEQARYETVLEALEKARELREQIRSQEGKE